MAELLPCPFCGSDKVSFHEDEEQFSENTTTGFIWCCGCGFSSDSFYNKRLATAKWNRRARPENKPADVVPVVRGKVDYETNRFAAYCPNRGADNRGSEGGT